jgi:hypothetical protein
VARRRPRRRQGRRHVVLQVRQPLLRPTRYPLVPAPHSRRPAGPVQPDLVQARAPPAAWRLHASFVLASARAVGDRLPPRACRPGVAWVRELRGLHQSEACVGPLPSPPPPRRFNGNAICSIPIRRLNIWGPDQGPLLLTPPDKEIVGGKGGRANATWVRRSCGAGGASGGAHGASDARRAKGRRANAQGARRWPWTAAESLGGWNSPCDRPNFCSLPRDRRP